MIQTPTTRGLDGEAIPLTPEEIAFWEAEWAAAPLLVPTQITALQFLIQLEVSGIITHAEALAAARTGEVPTNIAAIFANLPPEQVSAAEITWARMTTVPRSDPLFVLAAGPPLNMTEAQIDDFFRAAAAIP